MEFLTPRPTRDEGVKTFMQPSEISGITGTGFFWARTIKVPYLDWEQASDFLDELNDVLN